MKIRTDFVTNSSSSSFIIKNKTDKDLTLVDFVKENENILERYKEEYPYLAKLGGYTQEEMIECAISRNEKFPANSSGNYIYGDEDGDIIGIVYDYMLRDGGSSKSFSWYLDEYLR